MRLEQAASACRAVMLANNLGFAETNGPRWANQGSENTSNLPTPSTLHWSERGLTCLMISLPDTEERVTNPASEGSAQGC